MLNNRLKLIGYSRTWLRPCHNTPMDFSLEIGKIQEEMLPGRGVGGGILTKGGHTIVGLGTVLPT